MTDDERREGSSGEAVTGDGRLRKLVREEPFGAASTGDEGMQMKSIDVRLAPSKSNLVCFVRRLLVPFTNLFFCASVSTTQFKILFYY